MGIPGLTTYIANRSSVYFEDYQLHDCYLVIDGYSTAHQLYSNLKKPLKSNDCFGGDYDLFGLNVERFFKLLHKCNIVPLVVIDGGFEHKKLKTLLSRMRNKLSTADRITAAHKGFISVFPLFLRQVFMEVVQCMKIRCYRSDFEGDGETALLARSLGCPVLSFDSDYYVMDCLYIPFPTIDFRVLRNDEIAYLSCSVFDNSNFDSGFNTEHLPLLAVLLGNDYIRKSTFDPFFQHLKLVKSKENERQRLIKTLILWFKDQTPETALAKVLSRFNEQDRNKIERKIRIAMESYKMTESPILEFFKLPPIAPTKQFPTKKDHDEVQCESDEDEVEEFLEDEEMLDDQLTEYQEVVEDDSDEEEVIENAAIQLPEIFLQKYRSCVYDQGFMDLFQKDTFLFMPQVESGRLRPSHAISFEILNAMYTIFKSGSGSVHEPLKVFARGDGCALKKYTLPPYGKIMPGYEVVQKMKHRGKRRLFLSIVNMSNINENALGQFPPEWQLFAIAIKYWHRYWLENPAPNQTINLMAYIVSMIMGAMVISYVDQKVGFFRSEKTFLQKHASRVQNYTGKLKSGINKLNQLSFYDCVLGMDCLVTYFEMKHQMLSNAKLYDKVIVSYFASFQSCMRQINFLNTLLDFPFHPLIISKFYNGTFLHNMTANLQKRGDLHSYLNILLDNTPAFKDIVLLFTQRVCQLMDPGKNAFDGNPHKTPGRRPQKQENWRNDCKNCQK